MTNEQARDATIVAQPRPDPGVDATAAARDVLEAYAADDARWRARAAAGILGRPELEPLLETGRRPSPARRATLWDKEAP